MTGFYTRYRSEVLSDIPLAWTTVNSATTAGTCTVPFKDLYMADATGSYTTKAETRAMSDVETPNFHVRKARGEIVNSPMTSTYRCEEWPESFVLKHALVERYGCTPYRWYTYFERNYEGTLDFKAWLTTVNTTFLPVPLITADAISTMRDLAITDAWAHIDRSDVQALVTVAEADKTLLGFKYALNRAAHIYRAVAKKNWKLLKQQLSIRQMSEVYMEARYNLRPLYYDIQGLSKAFELKIPVDRYTFRGKRNEKLISSDLITVTVPGIPVGWYFSAQQDIARISSVDVTVRAGCLTKLNHAIGGKVFGLDLYTEAMWDLVPFSFILDWFINAGNTLASWTPNFGFTNLASWVTTTVVETQSIYTGSSQLTETSSASYRVQNPQASVLGSGSIITKTVTRDPDPTRRIIPHWEVKLDTLKLLDLGIITKSLAYDRQKIMRNWL